jgi:hypothetical protein
MQQRTKSLLGINYIVYSSDKINLSDVDYNLEAGKGYLEGTSKFKHVKVELNVSNAKTDQVHYWINEITNQYADFVVTNVKADPNKI